MTDVTAAAAGYQATAGEIAEVLAWFERYDALVAAADLEGMADMALFPINEVTDDAAGNGIAASCDRARFIEQMRRTVGAADPSTTTTSTRHPVFLGPALVFVVTDAEFRVGEQTHRMRYGDLLVRRDGRWLFQTMVGAGWGEQM
jgi:hypothetical protein